MHFAITDWIHIINVEWTSSISSSRLGVFVAYRMPCTHVKNNRRSGFWWLSTLNMFFLKKIFIMFVIVRGQNAVLCVAAYLFTHGKLLLVFEHWGSLLGMNSIDGNCGHYSCPTFLSTFNQTWRMKTHGCPCKSREVGLIKQREGKGVTSIRAIHAPYIFVEPWIFVHSSVRRT